MNVFLAFCMIAAIFFGVLNGLSNIKNVRNNPELGYEQSPNLLSFLFNSK